MKHALRRGAAGFGLIMMTALPSGAQVVPDGSTATTVTIGSGGAVTVGIAPVRNAGVSLNRYDTLNVAKPGVALDNRTVAARTIVNEVTGSGTTTIVGPVEVLGQRAHVIVANPNGIVVDAGRFINTGRVALTTGTIGTESRQIAPGVFQDNVTATVTGGRITIAGGGLSGQMEAVDLIAHDLRIAGAVSGSALATDAGLTLNAGQTRTEFDSAVLPGNTALSWARVTGSGAQGNGSVLVEVTVDGALRANQIGIVVNDVGAGVRLAGDSFATARSFVVDATGNVSVRQGRITGQGGVALRGSDVGITNASVASPAGPLDITASGGITLTDSGLSAQDMALTATKDLRFKVATTSATGSVRVSTAGDMVLHDSQLRAAGHLLLSAKNARLTNSATAPASELVAQNGALVVSLSEDLAVEGGRVQGGTKSDGLTNAVGLQSDGAITIATGGDIRIGNSTTTGIIFGAAGDTVLRAGGNMTVDQARVIANGDLNVDVAGNLTNWMGTEPVTADPVVTTTRKALWWSFGLLRKRVTTVRYAETTLRAVPVLQASGNVTLAAARVINRGGEINANGGAVDIRARMIENAAVTQGDMVLERSCLIVCVTKVSGSSRLSGGTINASEDVTLNATDAIASTGSTVLALGDLVLDAPSIRIGAVRLPTIVIRPGGLHSLWRDSAWLATPLAGGTITAQGKLTVRSAAPVTLVGGSLVAGGGVDNPAGQITLADPVAKAGVGSRDIGLLRKLPLMRD